MTIRLSRGRLPPLITLAFPAPPVIMPWNGAADTGLTAPQLLISGPLALGLAGDVYVVITKIAHSPAVGLAAGSLALISLIGLWYAYPLLAASIRTGPIP